MTFKGQEPPVLQEEVIWRPKNVIQLFENEIIADTSIRTSDDKACAPFRKFGIYVYIKSTSTPDVLHVEVEFLDRWTGQWYTYKQGLFAALFYEDGDTANGIYEAFVGGVYGRAMRAKLTGVNVAASGNVLAADKFFTVNIAADFWN